METEYKILGPHIISLATVYKDACGSLHSSSVYVQPSLILTCSSPVVQPKRKFQHRRRPRLREDGDAIPFTRRRIISPEVVEVSRLKTRAVKAEDIPSPPMLKPRRRKRPPVETIMEDAPPSPPRKKRCFAVRVTSSERENNVKYLFSD
jgi:hypothetical protein